MTTNSNRGQHPVSSGVEAHGAEVDGTARLLHVDREGHLLPMYGYVHGEADPDGTGAATDIQFKNDEERDLSVADPTNNGDYLVDVRGLQELTLQAQAGNNGSLSVVTHHRPHLKGNESQLNSVSISANNAIGRPLDQEDVSEYAFLRIAHNAPGGDSLQFYLYGVPFGGALGNWADEAVPPTRDGTSLDAETTGHQTQSQYQNVTSVEVSNPRRIKEVKAYFKDTSGGGNTTDWRVIAALDKSHGTGDAPTGAGEAFSHGDGSGWRLVDDGTLSSGGGGPVMGKGWSVRTHLVIAQARQGNGQETIKAQLSADEAG